jgi:hypothetical protein
MISAELLIGAVAPSHAQPPPESDPAAVARELLNGQVSDLGRSDGATEGRTVP